MEPDVRDTEELADRLEMEGKRVHSWVARRVPVAWTRFYRNSGGMDVVSGLARLLPRILLVSAAFPSVTDHFKRAVATMALRGPAAVLSVFDGAGTGRQRPRSSC